MPSGFSIRKSVRDGEEQPDIKTLVEKLYTYPDQEAVWWSGTRSEAILEYLLSGSENLWGTIDWETGTCDFSGELFAKILELAKRYANPVRKALEEKGLVSYYRPMWNPQEQLESEGRIVINYPFDDGNYPAYERFGNALLVNASSKHQEGIREFLEYLLDEKEQLQTTSEFTTESVEELYAFTEQRHSILLRTKEVLDITYEEAQTFCDGDKPLEEVCSIIRKQVRIYIGETM